MSNWLLLDLGNTRLKWCWAREGQLQTDLSGRLAHDLIAQLSEESGDEVPDRILLSSVAKGERRARVEEVCESTWGLRPDLLHTEAERGGLKNGYRDSSQLGVDRWLAMLGGLKGHGLPLIVADVGSATTLDAVDDQGKHLGGWILPGPLTMHDSLVSGTALSAAGLDEQTLAAGGGPAGDTDEAIATGVAGAQQGALFTFTHSVADRLGGTPSVVLTGGGAPWLHASIMAAKGRSEGSEIIVDPWLVFAGMLVASQDSTG